MSSMMDFPPPVEKIIVEEEMTHLKELENFGTGLHSPLPDFPDTSAVPMPSKTESIEDWFNGQAVSPWTSDERAAFVLGMHLFSRDFRAISRLVGSRSVHDVVLYYYGQFKHTPGYYTWRSTAARWGLRAEHLLNGRRQSRLLALMSAELPTKTSDQLYDLAEEYNSCSIAIDEFALRLADLAGRDMLVRNVELDTSGPTMRDGKLVVDAATIEWLLSARATTVKDHFFESVWPELEDCGWTTEDGARQGDRVFLAPSVSRDDPAAKRGVDYHDGYKGVLMHLQKHPELLPHKTDPQALRRGIEDASASGRPRRAAAIGAPFSWRSQRRVVRTPTAYLSPGARLLDRTGHMGVGGARRPLVGAKARPAPAGADSGKTCANCGTTTTPMWRKDKLTGAQVCNACGIYTKNHGRPRPVPNVVRPVEAAEPEEAAAVPGPTLAPEVEESPTPRELTPTRVVSKPRSAKRRPRSGREDAAEASRPSSIHEEEGAGSEEEGGEETAAVGGGSLPSPGDGVAEGHHGREAPARPCTSGASEDASEGTMNPGTPEPTSPCPKGADEAVSQGWNAPEWPALIDSMACAVAQHMAAQPGMDTAAIGQFIEQMVRQAYYCIKEQEQQATGVGMAPPPMGHPPPPPPASVARPPPGALRPVAVRPKASQASSPAVARRLDATLDLLGGREAHEDAESGGEGVVAGAAKRKREEGDDLAACHVPPAAVIRTC